MKKEGRSRKSRYGLSDLSTGFTLIELLVVIAIISLLVSILMPALDQARQLARMTACQVNMRTIGIAFALYAEENDEYPRFRTGYNTGHSWAYTLEQKEYASEYLFRCPDAAIFMWKTGSWYGVDIGVGYNAYFIGSNYWPLLSTDQAGQWGNPARPHEISTPTQTIFVTDTARLPDNIGTGSFSLYPRFRVTKEGAFARHRNESRINVLWGDGRAESVVSFQDVREPYPNPYPDLGPDPNATNNFWDRK